MIRVFFTLLLLSGFLVANDDIEEPGPKGLRDSPLFKDSKLKHCSPNSDLKTRDCGLATVQFVSGHYHDALLQDESQISFLSQVSLEPPTAIKEKAPIQSDDQAIWIPGYWDFLPEKNDFVWVSGIWRRPPPHHVWIGGEWKSIDGKWVRMKGFWSKNPLNELTFLKVPPPDQISDARRDNLNNNYFWMRGYWGFDEEIDAYTWHSGKWEKLDPNWVFVPATYQWREEGYIFNEGYFDWPLENRGIVYSSVDIPYHLRRMTYEPKEVVSTAELLNLVLLSYPNFPTFFCHHYYNHLDFWWNNPFCPPWWVWGWFPFPVEDHWAIWWWWTHPGYPAPLWLPERAIVALYGPPTDLIDKMKEVDPPIIVTPNGIAFPKQVLNALHSKNPILPTDEASFRQTLGEMQSPKNISRPLGKKGFPYELEKNPQPLPPISEDGLPKTKATPLKKPDVTPLTPDIPTKKTQRARERAQTNNIPPQPTQKPNGTMLPQIPKQNLPPFNPYNSTGPLIPN